MKIESFDKEKSVVITTMGQKLVRELQSTTQQETLEEAAENYSKGWGENNDEKSFIAGAKWQAERMYSEDEVDELVNNLISNFKNYNGSSVDNEKLKWFYQQLKNK